MQNDVMSRYMMWAVKIIAALFQVPATLYVFAEIFSEQGRPAWLTYFSAVMAVLLIDVFVIAVLVILESENIDPAKKLPWAVIAGGLLLGILWIGYMDEGLVAWIPRLGFIGLIMADILAWLHDYFAAYYSREKIEQRLRDRQVIQRRKAMLKAWQKAMQALRPDLIELTTYREARQLGIIPDTVDESPVKPVLESLIDKEESPAEHDEVEAGIFLIGPDQYAWMHPYEGLQDETATGKPYSLTGAKRARSRALNRNGH